MRRTILSTVCVLLLLLFLNQSRADDLKKLVDAAIAEEVKLLDDIVERFEKNKLKPAENKALFDRKTTTKKQRQERLDAIRKQVTAGEISFRLLDINQPKIGACGCLSSDKVNVNEDVRLNNIRVSQIVAADSFLGFGFVEIQHSFIAKGRGNSSSIGETRSIERSLTPLLFRGIPDSEKLVDGNSIDITVPLIISGRHSYKTVAAGVKTTFVLEPLSVCVKNIEDAQKKSKK